MPPLGGFRVKSDNSLYLYTESFKCLLFCLTAICPSSIWPAANHSGNQSLDNQYPSVLNPSVLDWIYLSWIRLSWIYVLNPSVWQFMCLVIELSKNLSVWCSACLRLSICLPKLPNCSYRSNCMSACLSVNPSVFLSACFCQYYILFLQDWRGVAPADCWNWYEWGINECKW